MKALAVAALLIVAVGCGGGGNGDSCPSDLPESCPSPAPGYADVKPVFESRCLRCHSPGGVEANIPLDSYQGIVSRKGTVLNQIYACRMPPAGEPAPTAEERKTLLDWFVCGAPQ